MSSEETDLQSIISRHEQEIDELQEHVKALEDGHTKRQLEAELAQKMADLEAQIRLGELQETMAKEEAEKRRKHRFFPWSRSQ